MTREELLRLRREAATWLRQMQTLPGFAERFAKIEELPRAVADQEWSVIVELTSGTQERARAASSRSPRKRGTVGAWQWVYEDEARRSDVPPEVLEHFERAEQDGESHYLLPTARFTPKDQETLFAIDTYRASVQSFAKEFLDSKPWASESVHRAIRDRRPIRLSPLPAAPGIKAPADLRIDVKRGDEIPYDIAVILAEFAKQIPKPQLHEELGPQERKKTWDGALHAVAKNLTGQKTTSTERGSRHDARRYLTAAATGHLRPDKPR
ncbi:MAG: hypothetical protein ACYC91_19820 [Solirubrobacteraceae bacterium]